jgi:hypothetical protein
MGSGGRDDAEVTPAAGLVARDVVVLVGAGWRGRTAGLTDRLGEGGEVVGGGRRRHELAVVADQFPASGGGEAAGVWFTQVVRVRLGERGEGADHRGRVTVDVGQRGNRLPGTAIPGATPW